MNVIKISIRNEGVENGGELEVKKPNKPFYKRVWV
jgi:hypothetical protein